MLTHGSAPVHGAAAETPRAGRCRHCGGELFQVTCERGPHFARLGCRGCGRFAGWVPKPWTIARARSFVLPFGKYRGRTLGALAATDAGRGYVQWLAANVEGNAGAAARVLLDSGRAGR